jgi:hypothetical protein
MRLYGAIEKVEEQDDGTVKVHGIASTEEEDDQGEIVKGDAMRAALPDYMKFPAIREMHQLSAAGTAIEIDVGADNVTRLVAHVVDPIAVAKVRNQVYRGFSIGGKVTKREAGAPKIITGILLNEISLVDRPANPGAVFDMWKADMGEAAAAPFNAPIQIWRCAFPDHVHLAKGDALKCLEKRHTIPAETGDAVEAATVTARAKIETEQEVDGRWIGEDTTVPGALVYAATEGEARTKAADLAEAIVEDKQAGGDAPGNGDKPYGNVTYADPGYQSDGKKRYPIDTAAHIRAAWNYINKPKNSGKYSPAHAASIKSRIVSAWKDKIDPAGPPSAAKTLRADMGKALEDIGPVAMVIRFLDEMCEGLEYESMVEGDDSPLPARMHGIVAELCAFLRDQAEEETTEIEHGTEIEPEQMAMAAPAAGEQEMEKRSDGDQHLMNVAHNAIGKALSMDGMTSRERGHMVQAHEAMKAAGAWEGSGGTTTEHSTVDTARNPEDTAPQVHSAESHSGVDRDPTGLPVGGKASQSVEVTLALIDAALGKASMGHKHLMDVAHECCAKLTDGATCKDDAGKAARHSQDTLDHLHKCHFHLVAAGAKCDAGGMPDEHQGTKFSAAPTEDLAKAQLDAFAKAFEPFAAQLAEVAKDVAAIKATPLPPLTMARGMLVEKTSDGGAGNPPDARDAIIKALTDATPAQLRDAGITEEQRGMALIKQSLANPYLPRGGASASEIRSGETR